MHNPSPDFAVVSGWVARHEHTQKRAQSKSRRPKGIKANKHEFGVGWVVGWEEQHHSGQEWLPRTGASRGFRLAIRVTQGSGWVLAGTKAKAVINHPMGQRGHLAAV